MCVRSSQAFGLIFFCCGDSSALLCVLSADDETIHTFCPETVFYYFLICSRNTRKKRREAYKLITHRSVENPIIVNGNNRIELIGV